MIASVDAEVKFTNEKHSASATVALSHHHGLGVISDWTPRDEVLLAVNRLEDTGASKERGRRVQLKLIEGH